jgi:hypothetical protein
LQPFDAHQCKLNIERIVAEILRYSSFTLVHCSSDELIVYSSETKETKKQELDAKTKKTFDKLDLIWANTETIYIASPETLKTLGIPSLEKPEFASSFVVKAIRHDSPAFVVIQNEKKEENDIFSSEISELNHFVAEACEFLLELSDSMEPKLL